MPINLKKIKCLFLMNTMGGIGGAERFVMDYFKFIDYDRYAVIWAVKEDTFSSHLKLMNLPVKIVNLPDDNNKQGIVKRFIKFYLFFRNLKPNCIVFSQFWLKSFSLPEFIAGFIVTNGNVNMIVHDSAPEYEKYKSRVHFGFIPGLGLEWRRERLFQKMLVYFTKQTIAVSNTASTFLIKIHKFPRNRIKVVYHGVDTKKYAPSLENRIKLRVDLGIPNSDTIILSTARLDKIKRLDRLIEAFSYLSKKREDIHLVFAGIGNEYGNLINMVNVLNDDIKNRIKFLGFKEEVCGLLQASDIYVLPSDSEGLSLALLEAMSCGLITVTTDCGGPSEIIKDGNNGFLVKKNIEGVIDGLEKALNLKEDDKKNISNRARELMSNNFNISININTALNLLGIYTNGKY